MVFNVVLGVIGAFFGAALLKKPGGAVLGFIVGCLAAMMFRMKRRMGDLERRVAAVESRPDGRPSPKESPAPGETAAMGQASPAPPGEGAAEASPPAIPPKFQTACQTMSQATGWWEQPVAHSTQVPALEPEIRPEEGVGSETEGRSGQRSAPPGTPTGPSIAERWTGAVKTFFAEGNVVVRIGVIVLFFGVAFLLKYAADRNAFPVEFRLAGVAAGAIALLALGWRLRLSRQGYALILQGAAAGVLYVTLFAAAKLYHLIPLPLALGFMVALVALSGWLAVLQDARSLAAFGAAGGFLAPVLVSSGGGSHVMLFSYYALLNAGILGIAWFKAWRSLNLIGFFFTFAIGSAWGYEHYRPAHFYSTEPFLVLFFLFYVAISVLFAHRQPVRLRGYVDGTLTFGVPVVVFALQARLVRGMDWGLAYSAIAMGGFYVGLSALLWQRTVTGMRLLTEAFLALGVVFVSLAVPLALDGRWTAAAWALEGAALVWIGIRQNRVPARCFGLMLQVGAGVAFFRALGRPAGTIPVLNGVCLGSLLISVSGLFSAWFLERHGARLRRWERFFHLPMLFWGLAWWFGGGLNEISRQLSWKNERPAALVFAALGFGGVGALSGRLTWPALKFPAVLWLPLLWLLAGVRWTAAPGGHLFADWYGAPWLLAAGVHVYLLLCFERLWEGGLLKLWHLFGLLLLVFVLSWESAWAVHRMVGGSRLWWTVMWGIMPGAAVLALSTRGAHILWPVQRFSGVYLGAGPAILAAVLFLWSLGAAFTADDPAPLSYLPVLNPLDISQAFAFAVILKWAWQARQSPHLELFASAERAGQAVAAIHGAVAVGVFVWLNSMVARTVHFWTGVPYAAASLYRSMLFQAAAAILWTLLALGAMAVGARKGIRAVWFAGAGLLGLVVVKLFIIDLGGSGTVARIVSFIAVGVLMLLIGYVSPLPPRTGEKTGDRDGSRSRKEPFA